LRAGTRPNRPVNPQRDADRSARTEALPRYRVGVIATARSGPADGRRSSTEGDPVFDLAMEPGARPDALAVMGEALGQAGISVEGGGVFTADGRPIAHFLVEDGEGARRSC
jgi:hypothetical protein